MKTITLELELTKEELRTLFLTRMFDDSDLGKLLQDVEFWEGGMVWIEGSLVGVSGDNGLKEFTFKELQALLNSNK